MICYTDISSNYLINKIFNCFAQTDSYINRLVNVDITKKNINYDSLNSIPHCKTKLYFFIFDNDQMYQESFYYITVKANGTFISKEPILFNYFENKNIIYKLIFPFANKYFIIIEWKYYHQSNINPVTYKIFSFDYKKYILNGYIYDHINEKDYILIKNKNIVLNANIINRYYAMKLNSKTYNEAYAKQLIFIAELVKSNDFQQALDELRIKIVKPMDYLNSLMLLYEF